MATVSSDREHAVAAPQIEDVATAAPSWGGRLGLHVGATLAGIGAVAVAFPHLMGTTWAAIGTAISSASVPVLAGLVLLWLAGLTAHTIVLTAALPGLSHRRAMLLSLTGSAVANVLPLGGAAGIALNLRMTRSWGFTSAAFVAYTVVTNVWDVLAKAFVPIIVIPVLVLGGPAAHHATRLLATTAIALPAIGILVAAGLFSRDLLPRLQQRVDSWRLGHTESRWARRAASVVAAWERARASSANVAGRRWESLTAGMALYTALLFGLLLACLHVSGAGVPLGLVVVAFCGERLLTLVGLTPGGLGFVEIGLGAALMLAPSASGAGVAAGVLLYRLLTFGLEIPVGGTLLAGWSWHRLRLTQSARPSERAAVGGASR